MREGFREVTQGWMLVDDVEALGERIEETAAWAKAHAPLEKDEAATVALMVKCQIAKAIKRGDFEPYIHRDADAAALLAAGVPAGLANA